MNYDKPIGVICVFRLSQKLHRAFFLDNEDIKLCHRVSFTTNRFFEGFGICVYNIFEVVDAYLRPRAFSTALRFSLTTQSANRYSSAQASCSFQAEIIWLKVDSLVLPGSAP